MIKRIVVKLISKLSPRLYFTFAYFHNRHRFPDFKHPKDLSEIWIKRVLDGKVNELSYLADKYEVRNYVKQKGLESLLTPLIGVYESGDEIDFNILPDKFALKANFGAAMNIICTDKSKLDVSFCRDQIRDWLKPTEFSFSERHYNLISKKIICEEYIDDGTGGFPVDYKFMCIHGKVRCILACFGREKGHADYLPYNLDWQPIYDYHKGDAHNTKLLTKPANLNEMIVIAETLASGIDLVRVDLYSNGTRIWFGEITLTPSGCIFHRWTQKALDEMGRDYYK